MKKTTTATVCACALLASGTALADTFPAGSLIIPMDTTYQDMGMLKAYGLVYELLRNDVPIYWTIRRGKAHLGADFTADAVDHETSAVITAHGYRGGPWVVDASGAAVAIPIIDAWQAAHTTAVHEATSQFTADVARKLIVAPTIAMFADGKQDVARGYMVASGIPDSALDPTWPDSSPDMLDPTEMMGPTDTNHHDGALFDEDGDPIYCQFMSMHWDVNDARDNPEVVAEVRQYLYHPVHFFAECQAVTAFENDLDNGLFLSWGGLDMDEKIDYKLGEDIAFYNHDSPFAQIDGPFEAVGGSEPTFTLSAGSTYKAGGVMIITESTTPEGVRDIWMTGYLDGVCDEGELECGGIGKVSYLGGHKYETKLPISANPKTQGTRLFLNSLFEAPCATSIGQPQLNVSKNGPTSTTDPQVTYTIGYGNSGLSVALGAVLTDPLPAGSTFVSATGNWSLNGNVLSWDLGNLGRSEMGSVDVTVTLPGFGAYNNQATLDYRVGMNDMSMASNLVSTVYDLDSDGDGVVDSLDICPNDYNPGQDLSSDIQSCGTCGTVCTVLNGTPACNSGSCEIASCTLPFGDCDGDYSTGCEYDANGFPTDPANCGGCAKVCAPLNATAACVSGSCSIGSCDAGYSDCNAAYADGCEYDDTGFQTDRNNCGGCTLLCLSNQVCESGGCVAATCPAGTADCVAPPPRDCETDTDNDVANCGGCGLLCDPPDATGACLGGTCTIAACDPGHSDCNALPGDGCEYDDAGFDTDLSNCGGCGLTCSPANATAACVGGGCTIASCDAGFSDCNGLPGNGCEYDNAGFETDLSNCGDCGQVCAPQDATGACAARLCSIVSCDAGFMDLDGDVSNGCEYACTATAADDATCDDADDDCDGEIDEDYSPYSCGTGICVMTSTCDGGSESCTPNPPATEGPGGDPTCGDYADNDCDGLTDLLDPADCPFGPPIGAGGEAGSGGAAGAAGGGGIAGEVSAGAGGSSAAGAAGSAGTTGDAGTAGAARAGAAGTGTDTGTGGMAGSAAEAGAPGTEDAGATGSGGTGGSTAGDSGTPPTDGGIAAAPGDGSPGPSGTAGDEAGRGGEAVSGDEGGCGCRTAGTPLSSSWSLLLSALGLALALVRRRRQLKPVRGTSANKQAR